MYIIMVFISLPNTLIMVDKDEVNYMATSANKVLAGCLILFILIVLLVCISSIIYIIEL